MDLHRWETFRDNRTEAIIKYIQTKKLATKIKQLTTWVKVLSIFKQTKERF